MIAFSFIIPILFLSLPIFGLFVIVKKEAMETEKNISESEKGNEKKQPAFHLFLYLTSFFSLGFLISGIINVYFELVNKYVEDPAFLDQFSSSSQFDDSSVKYGLSVLLISGLVYFPISYLINRKLEKGEIRQDSLVRKFLTYIALFILIAIAIGSLAVLFFDYLNGELTGNAFGKIITFFLTAGFFAAYYFWEIRRKEFAKKAYQMFYGAAVLVALSGFIVGFAIADSPTTSREKKIDNNVISEMQNIKSDIESLYNNNKNLPTVEEIQQSAKYDIKYIVKSDKEYQLCAKFLQVQDKKDFYDKEWNHPAGDYCFNLNIEARDNKSND